MFTKEQVKSKLLNYWQVKELKFIAEFHRPKKDNETFKQLPYGYFRNFRIAEKDRSISYPPTNGLEYKRQLIF